MRHPLGCLAGPSIGRGEFGQQPLLFTPFWPVGTLAVSLFLAPGFPGIVAPGNEDELEPDVLARRGLLYAPGVGQASEQLETPSPIGVNCEILTAGITEDPSAISTRRICSDWRTRTS